MCAGRPCSRWCELVTEQDMHYCPEHWPFRPGGPQWAAASDDANANDPHDATGPQCMTVADSRVLMLSEDDESDHAQTSDSSSWRELHDASDSECLTIASDQEDAISAISPVSDSHACVSEPTGQAQDIHALDEDNEDTISAISQD